MFFEMEILKCCLPPKTKSGKRNRVPHFTVKNNKALDIESLGNKASLVHKKKLNPQFIFLNYIEIQLRK
jgi:hypothetical protein